MVVLVGFENTPETAKNIKNLIAEVYNLDYTMNYNFGDNFHKLTNNVSFFEDAKYGGDISFISSEDARTSISKLANSDAGIELSCANLVNTLKESVRDSSIICRNTILMLDGISNHNVFEKVISSLDTIFQNKQNEKDSYGKIRVIINKTLEGSEREKFTKDSQIDEVSVYENNKLIKTYLEDKKRLKIFL